MSEKDPHTIDVCSHENEDINQIKVCSCNEEEVLIAVTHSADVFVFYTLDLNRAPIQFENKYQNELDNSTWSLTANPVHPLIAVGSNSRNITIFDLAMH